MNFRLVGRYLFIYQMPKTGSQTVLATLEQCSLPHQIFRFHFLSDQIATSLENAINSGRASDEWQELARDQLRTRTTIQRIIRARKWLRLCRIKVPKLDIITSVREPIGLALSSTFENHSFFFSGLDAATAENCRAELMRPKCLKQIQNWFDLELKPHLDLDIYATRFPQRKGYAIYEHEFARFLVFRYEAIRALPAMLNEFLGCFVPAIINRNRSDSKDYAAMYAQVKQQLRLPLDFLRAQYSTRMVQHFYSDDERRELMRRWGEEAETRSLSSSM
ncbi:MAG TPA: putative capsular polysaccharide synthesis family protein [Candidatus Limnocylindrales bacterium]|nr:putative capsular polysaccharide synthesis family protein [Candidatus Limnocylindrales bacterium]